MEASEKGFNEWEMVDDDDDFSVSRQSRSHREGSPPINPESEIQESDSTTAPSSPGHQEDWNRSGPVLDNSSTHEIFKWLWNCWIRKLGTRVWDSVCLRSGLWAFGSVTAMPAAALMWWLAAASWRRRAVEEKSRLVLLIREKDQRIKQLLVDIGKINELLMGRRKVTVVRIGKAIHPAD